jgi:hypothetical protein
MEIKKYQRPQQEITCSSISCENKFLKDCSEVRRNLKLNRLNYCSLGCASKSNANVLGKGSYKYLKDLVRGDEFTGFREHLCRVRARCRENENKTYSITLQDLVNQWDKQRGICPYTGINLLKPKQGVKNNLLCVASLDRIDSKIGYDVNNIQFVSAAANMAKNNMSHEEMIQFCKIIAKFWN